MIQKVMRASQSAALKILTLGVTEFTAESGRETLSSVPSATPVVKHLSGWGQQTLPPPK